MPCFDRTGPAGQGALTGRGFGPCGKGLQERQAAGNGFGPCGKGKAFGRCFGYRFWQKPAEPTKEEKIEMLEAEKNGIERALKELKE